MDWQPAPDALIEMVEDEFEEPMNEVRYVRLPFYEDGYLVEATTPEYCLRAAFGGMIGVTLVPLDGRFAQIAMANRVCGLALNRNNVGEYAKFCCGHIASRAGEPYAFLEDCEGRQLQSGHKLRDMRVKVRHQDDDGAYRVGGYQSVSDQLFRVSLRIALDGSVRMARDLKLGPFIGVMH